MSIWVDKKYAGIAGQQLERFKVVNSSPYNAKFRCVYCGDSKKNKFKTRGYLYEDKGKIYYKCHNCGVSTTLGGFLEYHSPVLFSEYKLESFGETGKSRKEVSGEEFQPDMSLFTKRRINKFPQFKNLYSISQLEDDHYAKEYVVSRKIPVSKHYKMFYCGKFYKWINSILPNKFEDKILKKDGPRLVLPFISTYGYVFGVQGRSLDGSEPRYITIMFDEDHEKVFGLDEWDETKRTIVVEGPIDSLFLPNCLAYAGLDGSFTPPKNSIICLDNEPRALDIVRRLHKYIHNGYKVCIWPSNIQAKDINDLILQGYTSDQVEDLIVSNSYSGLKAQAKFIEWKKI